MSRAWEMNLSDFLFDPEGVSDRVRSPFEEAAV